MAGDSRINDLLGRWEAARAQGQDITVEQLCTDCPELIGELKREIETRKPGTDKTKTLSDDSGATQEYSGTPTQRPAHEDAGLSVELRFGRLKLHGRGGLGEVYVALDQFLNREVAVKFLNPRHAEDPESRAQFVREVEITGRLEHPGVVAVHGIGTGPNQQPFYVMRFIDGDSFEKAIARFHQPGQADRSASSQVMEFRNLLSRFASVCNTIAYAHNRGVIHRDIKPDNIMLGRFGETLVVDWGLAMPVDRTAQARASGEKTLLPTSGSQSGSSSGGGAGTPAYMSPEQAGGSEELTPATDIYSLGATLYKLLTGETPFKGDGPREIMNEVKQGRFLPPRAVKNCVPPALEAICLKAMAMRPIDRYATALELAGEIEHWLGDEPVRAYREKPVQRLSRWTRRHRGLAVSGAIGVAAVVLITSVAAILLGRTAFQERQAREQAILLSAKFAADAIASEIDLRLRTLESEAADPELLKHMDEANAKTDDGPMQEPWREQLANWVNRRFINHNKNKPTKAGTWWVTNRSGRIVALQSEKFVEPEKYLKESFTERAWFHGGERDLPKEEARSKGIGPTKHATLVAFHSKADNQLKVAFSVPIRSREDAPVLGVLSMAVRLGEFSLFQKELAPGKQVVLVSLNSDWIDNGERRGLVLHHPDLAATEETGSQPRPLRVTPDTVELLLEFRKQGIRRANSPVSGTKSEGGPSHLFQPKYLDGPGDVASGSWLAAAEPVIVESRPNREGEKIRDCGWAVIVQERR